MLMTLLQLGTAVTDQSLPGTQPMAHDHVVCYGGQWRSMLLDLEALRVRMSTARYAPSAEFHASASSDSRWD